MLLKTKQVLDILSKELLFKKHDIRFVGGTALSYLIDHRLSEDLDFAMLSLCPDEIEQVMQNLGATGIPHSITATEYAHNEGTELKQHHLKYLLHDIKVEFFTPPFNLLEKEVWEAEPTSQYESSNLQVASFKTIIYMKSMAFWNRKKYRDLFDIYYVLYHYEDYNIESFVNDFLKYNITYSLKDLHTKIESKNSFHEKRDDEGINTLVTDPKPYEWYRAKIEEMIYDLYLKSIYDKK